MTPCHAFEVYFLIHSTEAAEVSQVLLLLSAPTVCHSIQPPESASLSGRINIPTDGPVFACSERSVSNFHFHETEMLAVRPIIIARMLISFRSRFNCVQRDGALLGHQGYVPPVGKTWNLKSIFL